MFWKAHVTLYVLISSFDDHSRLVLLDEHSLIDFVNEHTQEVMCFGCHVIELNAIWKRHYILEILVRSKLHLVALLVQQLETHL